MSSTDTPAADLGQPSESAEARALWRYVYTLLDGYRQREGWAALWWHDFSQYTTTPTDRAHGLERLARRIEAQLDSYPWEWLAIEETAR